MSVLDAALRYYGLGWSVIPIAEGSKEPHYEALRTTRGFASWRGLRNQRATAAELRDIWLRYPSANVGVLTGTPIVVADVEPGNPIPAELLMMKTPHALSVRGGHHFWFSAPPGTAVPTLRQATTGWGDLVASRSYVVAPPSSGREWIETPFDTPLAPLPEYLLDLAYPHSTCGVGVTGEPRVEPATASMQLSDGGTQETEEFASRALDVIGVRYRSLTRVFCPFHDDRQPSAGVFRGSADGGWVLGCRRCGYAYSLSQAYARARGAGVLHGPMLAKWFHRLCAETGVLTLPTFNLEVPRRTSAQQRFAEGFLLLFAIDLATARPGDVAASPFTSSFASGWCGISESSCLNQRRELEESGWLVRVDELITKSGLRMIRWRPRGYTP